MNRAEVKQWLIEYAWIGTKEQKEATVECILSQDGWKYIDTMADRFAGAAEVPGPDAFDEGTSFALSALYECHDGPHLPTCPEA